MIDELDFLWEPNFRELEYISFLGQNFPGMRGLILVLMPNVCYLVEILIFLVVTTGQLVVTSGYCSLLVVTARYRSLLLIPTFSMNGVSPSYEMLRFSTCFDPGSKQILPLEDKKPATDVTSSFKEMSLFWDK